MRLLGEKMSVLHAGLTRNPLGLEGVFWHGYNAFCQNMILGIAYDTNHSSLVMWKVVQLALSEGCSCLASLARSRVQLVLTAPFQPVQGMMPAIHH